LPSGLTPTAGIIPDDFEQRAAAYDARRRRTLSVRVLSAFDLEAQISSDGATWLDRQILGRAKTDPVESGFGREVIDAKRRRVQVLVARGFAERDGENRLSVRRDLLSTLEQREVARVGQELAEKRNIPFRQAKERRARLRHIQGNGAARLRQPYGR
jgi:hypothetical protein